MTEKQKEFLEKLNKLMQEYNASFGYTTDDDGVHVSVDGSECFIGWLDHEMGINDLPDALRHNT